MRKAIWVLILAGFAAVLCPPVLAEKVTADPNGPGAQAGRASSNDEADPRLAQPVTYDGGYRRLYDVTSDLQEKTGVHLRCGTNASDWQVRDVPLVVCSKDLPLGKLLRAVADATHTEFTTETVASEEKDNAKRSYRIYRTAKTAASIAAKFDAKQAGMIAETQWAWDSLIAFGKSGIEDPNASRDAVLFAKILAALEPEVARKLFSGETLILNTDNVANASQLRELYTFCCKHNRCRSKADPRPEELQRSEIRVSPSYDRGVTTGLTAICYFNGGDYWFSGLNDQAGKLRNVKGFELAPRPVVPEPPKPVDEYPSDRLVMLKTPEDWGLPALATKISLEAPMGKEHLTFSDAVVAIAKASGFNVICEDFETHQNSSRNGYIGGDPKFDTRVDSFFVRDTTLGEALKKLGSYDGNWFINERDKLIVGWAHDWRSRHRSLVQEKLVEGIRKKMDGDGAQLDDVTPMANLTDDQIQEWFRNSHAMYRAVWFWGFSDDVSAWRLYESLNADQKKLAKSETGIPLAVFDADTLHAFFEQRRKETPRPGADDDTKERIRREEEDKNALLSDPKTLPRVILRVVEGGGLFLCQDGRPGVLVEGLNSGPVYDPTNNPALRSRSYHIRLEGERNGEKLSVNFKGTFGGSGHFPVFTPERGKAIADDLRRKDAAAKSK